MLSRDPFGYTVPPVPSPGIMLSFLLRDGQESLLCWPQAVLLPESILRIFSLLLLCICFCHDYGTWVVSILLNCTVLCHSMSGQYPTITGYRKSGTIQGKISLRKRERTKSFICKITSRLNIFLFGSCWFPRANPPRVAESRYCLKRGTIPSQLQLGIYILKVCPAKKDINEVWHHFSSYCLYGNAGSEWDSLGLLNLGWGRITHTSYFLTWVLWWDDKVYLWPVPLVRLPFLHLCCVLTDEIVMTRFTLLGLSLLISDLWMRLCRWDFRSPYSKSVEQALPLLSVG